MHGLSFEYDENTRKGTAAEWAKIQKMHTGETIVFLYKDKKTAELRRRSIVNRLRYRGLTGVTHVAENRLTVHMA